MVLNSNKNSTLKYKTPRSISGMFHQVLQCAVTAVLSTFAAHTHKWVNHNVNHNVNSTILEWFLYIIEVAYSTDIIIEVAYSTDMRRRMVCVLGLSHRLIASN